MAFPTDEQRKYIEEAPPDAVLIACPGSGKTTTAVERFISRCKSRKGYGIAYLSYTKVAVREARRQAMDSGAISLVSYPNEILTIDSFFRAYVFDIFAYIVHPDLPKQMIVLEDRITPTAADMNKVAIWGVLQNKDGSKRPLPSWKIHPYLENGALRFRYERNEYTHEWEDLPSDLHKDIVKAKIALLFSGYTTHADLLLFSRFLLQRSGIRVAEILAKRFSEIIVDEAQDTSEIQQEMFQQLAAAGAQISYVGDPGQGIYQFNKANPRFLNALLKEGKQEFRLDETFRSIRPIVDVLNARFARGMTTNRAHKNQAHGAYVLVCDVTSAIDRFKQQLVAGDVSLGEAAIIARNWGHLEEIVKSELHTEWSAIPRYAARAYQRQKMGEFAHALEAMLLVLRAGVERQVWDAIGDVFQRALAWGFLRSSYFAAPGDRESVVDWCGRLRKGLEQYVELCGLQKSKGFGQNSSARKMDKTQLVTDAICFEEIGVRATVIHQVKGETIRGVLVVAPQNQHVKWLNDVKEGDEEFNICYVAFSRAADVLMLQCPTNEIADEWVKHGLKKI